MTTTSDDIKVITLDKDYDIYSSKELESVLSPTVNFARVVVDFRHVRYVDSTALAVFVKIRKLRAARGFAPKHFANVNASIRNVLHITALDTIWPIFDDLSSAIAAF